MEGVELLFEKAVVYDEKGFCRHRNIGDMVWFNSDPNIFYRASMEDKAIVSRLGDKIWLYAVMDGHGGVNAAEYLSKNVSDEILKQLRNNSKKEKDGYLLIPSHVKNIIFQSFLELDYSWFSENRGDPSGTTFTGVLITSNSLYSINLGDSRTVMESENYIYSTIDQKPSDECEKDRIYKAGSFISKGRVGGILALSRAIGDNEFKVTSRSNEYAGINAPVSPIPVVKSHIIVGDEKIIIACDGIFDVMDNYEALQIGTNSNNGCELMKEAKKRITTDNISAMYVKL